MTGGTIPNRLGKAFEQSRKVVEDNGGLLKYPPNQLITTVFVEQPLAWPRLSSIKDHRSMSLIIDSDVYFYKY